MDKSNFFMKTTARSRGGGVCLAPGRGSKVPKAKGGKEI